MLSPDPEPIVLSEKAIATLMAQTIDRHGPGKILDDIEVMLNYLEAEIPVSDTKETIPMTLLAEMDAALSLSIPITLQRPQQQSYSQIHGLYLLLRMSGLARIKIKGKKKHLVLNPEVLESYRSLNPTEQYCCLLEIWLIRADDRILGGTGLNGAVSKSILFYWRDGVLGDNKYFKDPDNLSYNPGYHHLALMHLFGMLTVTSDKAIARKKAWPIKSITPTTFGYAILELINQNDVGFFEQWEGYENPSAPIGELQMSFGQYFPEWRNSLAVPQVQPIEGMRTFRVALRKIWRRIEISSDLTLDALADGILDSVEFDSDHLYQFTYQSLNGRTIDVTHPYMEESPSTDEVKIIELPLEIGESMKYLFDFGDCWRFTVTLESIDVSDTRSQHLALIETHGKAPEQYPSYDED
jgi:hypothetical protein